MNYENLITETEALIADFDTPGGPTINRKKVVPTLTSLLAGIKCFMMLETLRSSVS